MKFDLTGQTPSRYTRTFYLSTHQGYPFCSQYIELWIREYHMHYGLGEQWKLMERFILLQTLFLFKKKNWTRHYQCCNRTCIKEDRKWKMFSRLWGLLHHDCKLVKYFIFFQRIGDYLFAKGMRLSFLGWKKPRLWGWNILIYVKDYLNLWSWFFQFYYNTNLVTLSL